MIIEAIVTAYVLHGTMANGQKVHQGSIACPRSIKFGTEIIIKNKHYFCHDRTSLKNDGRFDIWMEEYDDAIQFGKQKLKVTICKK